MGETLFNGVESLLSKLPLSPFRPYIDALEEIPFLGYVNWLIPFGDFVKIGGAWLVAVTGFYIMSAALRWAKIIE